MIRPLTAAIVAVTLSLPLVMSAEAGFHVCGDPDNNETVNSVDALLVLQHTAGLSPLQGNAIGVADVNNDEVVDSVDASIILQHVAGVLKELDCTG